MNNKLITLTAALLAAGSVYALPIPTVPPIAGNGGTGFGGVVGPGTLEVTADANSTVLTFTVTKGSANFNDTLTIYIDSVVGGFADTTAFSDFADGGRSHISSGNTTDANDAGDITFPANFEADYAINVGNGWASLFGLAAGGNNSHNYISGGPQNGATSATFAISINVADLGISDGDSFDIVTIYGHGGYQSDESFNNLPATGNYANGAIDMDALGVTPITLEIPAILDFDGDGIADDLDNDDDGDGLLDIYEDDTGIWVSSTQTGTDPRDPDTDGDGLLDGVETNTGTFVAFNGDFADVPDLGDSATNPGLDTTAGENDTGTDPHSTDTDGDRMPDNYEAYPAFADTTAYSLAYVLDPNSAADASANGDGDDITNLEEYLIDSDPTVNDGTDFSFGQIGLVSTVNLDLGNDANDEIWTSINVLGTMQDSPFQSGVFFGPLSQTRSFVWQGLIYIDQNGASGSTGGGDATTNITEFKFVPDGDFDNNTPNSVDWGDYTADGIAEQKGSNIAISNQFASGVYEFTFNEVTGEYSVERVDSSSAYPDYASYETAFNAAIFGLANPTPLAGAAADADGDTITNDAERLANTDPFAADSDGDTLSDSVETNTGTFAGANDTGSDPLSTTSDGDSLPDGVEVANGLNPNDDTGINGDAGDIDGDLLSNADEYTYGTEIDVVGTAGVYYGFLTGFSEMNLASNMTVPGFQSTSDNEFEQNRMRLIADSQWRSILRVDPNSGAASSGTANYKFAANGSFDISFGEVAPQDGTADFGTTTVDIQDAATSQVYYTVDFNETTRVYTFGVLAATDTDTDGMPDEWETFYGLDANDSTGINGATGDFDGDGILNADHFAGGTSPSKDFDKDGILNGPDLDDDNDGLADTAEDNTGIFVDANNAGSSPFKTDTDGDTISDFDEANGTFGPATNPSLGDTDGDGMFDDRELQPSFLNGSAYANSITLDPTDPTDADLDQDGDTLTNAQEIQFDFDPTDATGQTAPFSAKGYTSMNVLGTLNGYSAGNGFGALSLSNTQAAQWEGTVYLPESYGTAFKLVSNDSFDSDEYGDNEQDGIAEIVGFGGDIVLADQPRAGLYSVVFHELTQVYTVTPIDYATEYATYADFETAYNAAIIGTSAFELFGEGEDDDGDNLLNEEEYLLNSDPGNASDESDTDGDGLADGDELGDSVYNPGLGLYGSSPALRDTDGDGMTDGFEAPNGLNPNDATGVNGSDGDIDLDNVSNFGEFAFGSNPNLGTSKPEQSFSIAAGNLVITQIHRNVNDGVNPAYSVRTTTDLNSGFTEDGAATVGDSSDQTNVPLGYKRVDVTIPQGVETTKFGAVEAQ